MRNTPEIEAAIQAHIALTKFQASGERIAPAPVKPVEPEPVQELIIPPITLGITAQGSIKEEIPLKRSQRKKLIE